MMPALLAMFPGQGSQSVGMGKDLLANFPAARLTFEEAEDSISLGIRQLCLEGPSSELELTANQQPCILTLSIAIWRVLQGEAGLTASCFAGHSLGEYAALVASTRLRLPDAVRLVRRRGEAMQEAVPPGVGAMAAVIGCEAAKLVTLCREHATRTAACVEVVNFNSPQQQIISGQKKAVEAVCEALREEGIKTMPLPVSAPFHSSLMAPARKLMAPLLESQPLARGEGGMIPNLTGEWTSEYTSELLIRQIDSPVLWVKTLATAYDAGVRHYVEVGPGKVLFGLARRSLARDVKLVHSADLSACVQELSKL